MHVLFHWDRRESPGLVRAHSRSRVASKVRAHKSHLRPKVTTSKTPRERNPSALLKAKDSAHSPQVVQVLKRPPNFGSMDRLPSGVLW